MGGLFGKPKKHESRVTDQDKAVLQLKQQRDKLKQYQKRINVQMEKDRLAAKKYLQDGKKERAKLMLRKKKFQESLLEKTDGQLANIERLTQDIEFAQVESQVIAGLKSGNEALKKMHEVLTIEDVERVMDETQEGVEYQREIDAILAGGLTDEDEEDVLAELDQLTKAETSTTPVPEEDLNLPDVPSNRIKEKTTPARSQERVALEAS